MIPAGAQVFVATKPVDVPKGPASLMALVKPAGELRLLDRARESPTRAAYWRSLSPFIGPEKAMS